MTDRDMLLRLAERVEAASGPDRELDKSILRLIDQPRVQYMERSAAEMRDALRDRGLWEARGHTVEEHCNTSPRYTASLDAGMTLVGDDCWRVEDPPLAGPRAFVGDAEGYAATPALALCAASLRARAAMVGE